MSFGDGAEGRIRTDGLDFGKVALYLTELLLRLKLDRELNVRMYPKHFPIEANVCIVRLPNSL
jgi:hypothetical protein